MNDPGKIREAEIRRRLEAALSPSLLEIVDDGHLHAGHPGARDGRGHFRIRLCAAGLAGLSRIEQHRQVYAALGDLMETDIHALALQIETDNSAA